MHSSLQWRHNEHDSVSDHQPHKCLFNRLFKRRSKKTSKLRVTGLCARNSPGTGEFPAQKASNAENVSIWWRHHVLWTISAKCYILVCRWFMWRYVKMVCSYGYHTEKQFCFMSIFFPSKQVKSDVCISTREKLGKAIYSFLMILPTSSPKTGIPG